jgi:chromosome segregation ATPase
LRERESALHERLCSVERELHSASEARHDLLVNGNLDDAAISAVDEKVRAWTLQCEGLREALVTLADKATDCKMRLLQLRERAEREFAARTNCGNGFDADFSPYQSTRLRR